MIQKYRMFTSANISPNCDLQPLRLASKLFQSSTLEAETLTPTFDPGSCELDGTHIVVKNSLFSLDVLELWKTYRVRLIRAGEYCAAIRFKLHDLYLKIPKAYSKHKNLWRN